MTRSQELFRAAQVHIPGGVNSPVRAFGAVGGDPIFFKSGSGAWLVDEDNRRYVDYVGSWGPMIVGHAHPEVLASVRAAVESGLGFGAPNSIEIEMADTICALMPAIERVRMVNSGTEATMSAIRLARATSGREKIIKFEGCYHGHGDSLLVKAGSGALTMGVPTSPGVPAELAAHTITLEYNNPQQAHEVFAQHGNQIGAVIVEPVAGNMNCVPPQAEFLQALRRCCDDYGSVLIFDEVMTGFRVALGGAQALYGVTPDLTTLGKVIGGGLPVGAFGGRADLMQQIAPTGPVYQAGTLSGNPVALAAGLATLKLVSEPGFHQRLAAYAQKLIDGMRARAQEAGIGLACNQVGGMFGLFFTDAAQVSNFEGVTACDVARFKRFFHGMLGEGVYFAPSPYEAAFVSSAHGEVELNATLDAARHVFSQI